MVCLVPRPVLDPFSSICSADHSNTSGTMSYTLF